MTLLVQAARFIKRFYVRRFANNINRRMKGILYANLVRQSRTALEKEGAGELMTKAISDVDDCVERMLAAQLDNRRAVAAVSGQVPETLHNIRTIRALGLETYMERRYDRRIGDSYAAMERTNFYDAVYSPVVLLLNAVVVGVVMLLSASGRAEILTLFGMSVGTSVAVINYISRIFAPIESLGM